MKIRHKFIETMAKHINELQQIGPIPLLIGSGSEQIEIQAVFVISSLCLDNEECFKVQGLSFA
jgi:hypothetical protein